MNKMTLDELLKKAEESLPKEEPKPNPLQGLILQVIVLGCYNVLDEYQCEKMIQMMLKSIGRLSREEKDTTPLEEIVHPVHKESYVCLHHLMILPYLNREMLLDYINNAPNPLA